MSGTIIQLNEDAIQRELKELVRSSVKERGLFSPQLFIGDRCSGLVEAMATVYPKAKYQRRTVYFYRNMLSMTPRSKMKTVAAMLKAIHAQKDKAAVREKKRRPFPPSCGR